MSDTGDTFLTLVGIVIVAGFVVFGIGGCIERTNRLDKQHVENMAKMGYTLTNPDRGPAYWTFTKSDSCGGR